MFDVIVLQQRKFTLLRSLKAVGVELQLGESV